MIGRTPPGPTPRGPATVSRLIASTDIPAKAVGIFWLGGATVAVKSHGKCVYLFDPGFQSLEGGGPVGAIDVRPDLVVCTYHSPSHFNLSSLTNLSGAFPDVRFTGSEFAQEWMAGKGASDEVTVNPGRILTLMPGASVDVRTLGLNDRARFRILEDAGEGPEPWNVLMTFSGITVCLVRRTADRLDALCEALKKRPDVLLWSLEGENVEDYAEALNRIHPRYVLPIAYDRMPGGGDLARHIRDLTAGIRGTEAYLFPEDYQEGLIYSRMIRR